ncbi:hypothetical protein [Comamonas composti]|uniref:hypothetical protein n=1 Tax=Comamonas composti TaxID=408558 RepID=UPI00040BC945|nr:hypothetical protein [Comamonas composti]
MIAKYALSRALRLAALGTAAMLAQTASAACFYVYAQDQELIYRSNRSPVDLSLPLHQTVDRLFPGSRLVFTLDEFNCATEVDLLAERAHLAKARAERQGAFKQKSDS